MQRSGRGSPYYTSFCAVHALTFCGAHVDFVQSRGAKLEGYFSLPSVAHYLILDADRRKVVHHKRGVGDIVETRILAAGRLALDPPGLELSVENFFERL